VLYYDLPCLAVILVMPLPLCFTLLIIVLVQATL
jgi:hypothetical protein